MKKFFLQFFQNMFNVLANRSKVVSDMVLAIANLTRAVGDLTKAYTMMAKYQEDDRRAIAELYELQANLYAEIAGMPVSSVESLIEKPAAKPGLLETVQLEKKKKLLN